MTLHRRTSDAGLTMIEVLIVLAIIGVAGTATVMGTGVLSRGASAADEGARLAALLQVAADEALVGGAALRMDWSATGYGFRRPEGAAMDGRLQTARALPDGMTLQRTDGGTGALDLRSDGLGSAAVFAVSGTGRAVQVVFDGVKARVPDAGTP